MTFDLKHAELRDLSSLSKLHKQLYPATTHFTSRFSLYLLEVYYKLFFDKGSYVIKVEKVRDEISSIHGFLVCGVSIPAKIAIFKKKATYHILKTAFVHPIAFFKKVAVSLFHHLLDQATIFKESPFLVLSIVSDRSLPGIGEALLSHAKVLCKEDGSGSIGLYVRVNNLRAIRFYLRNDFAIQGYTSGQFYMEAQV